MSKPIYKYLALGCSITEGRGKSSRYPDIVQGYLAEALPDHDIVTVVQAYPGAVAGGAKEACAQLVFPKVNTYERLREEVIPQAPDLITVILGQPDSLQDFIPLADFAYYFNLILKTLLNETQAQIIAGGRVFNKIHSYAKHKPPWHCGSVEKALLYNDTMRQAAADNKIPFVDLYRLMDGRDDLFLFDGVHPNRLGHEFIAAQLIETFKLNGLARSLNI